MDKMDECIYLLEVGSVPRSYTVDNYLHNVFSFPSTIAILLTKDNLFKCAHFKAKQVFIFMSELLVSQFFSTSKPFFYIVALGRLTVFINMREHKQVIITTEFLLLYFELLITKSCICVI